MVSGTVTASTTGGTVTLAGSAIFTSSATYKCTASGVGNTSSSDYRFVVEYTSGSVFVVRATATVSAAYICVGN